MERYITKKSINGLVRKLGLPAGDKYSQDWEYEVASANIASKILKDYIERDDLTEDERFTLMHIILESINEFISDCGKEFPMMREFIEVALRDYAVHESTYEYWACQDNDKIDEIFELTPIIRKIIKQKSNT